MPTGWSLDQACPVPTSGADVSIWEEGSAAYTHTRPVNGSSATLTNLPHLGIYALGQITKQASELMRERGTPHTYRGQWTCGIKIPKDMKWVGVLVVLVFWLELGANDLSTHFYLWFFARHHHHLLLYQNPAGMADILLWANSFFNWKNVC